MGVCRSGGGAAGAGGGGLVTAYGAVLVVWAKCLGGVVLWLWVGRAAGLSGW